jgi:hypothetical protein
MDYLKVRWIREVPNEPVLLLSELDANRYEVKKVEVFTDGRMGFASADKSSDETMLGEKPIPPASDIAADLQFIVESTDAQEFESAWRMAVSGSRWQP